MRRATWNWRGSKAAVGCPAWFQMGLTSATLYLFAILNMSTMPSILKRSPNLISRATRRSLKIVYGLVPALRFRLPTVLPSMKHAGMKYPPGEYFEATAWLPQLSVTAELA